MDIQIRDHKRAPNVRRFTLSPSQQRELLLFGLLAGLGTVASYLSVNIPHTEVYIDGRFAFGFMGFALLRRWWAALLLAGLLSVAGFHQVPPTVYLPANMLYAVPALVTIRLVHTHLLSRCRHLLLYGLGWLLLVLACYQAFTTPVIWAVLALLREAPVWPAILAGWQTQPFLVESLLVGIVSASGMMVAHSHEALRQSRQELATTLDSIGDGVIATNVKGRVTHMNPVAQTLTGWPLAEAQNQPLEEIFQIINAHTRQPVNNPVSRVLREGVVVGLGNHTCLVARDGTERQIADSAAPIRQGEGRLAGTVMVFRDVTQEYQARAALRESEERFRSFVENASDIVYALTPEGIFTYISPNWLDFFGEPAEEAIGRSFEPYVHPEDVPLCRQFLAKVLQTGERHSSVEYRVRRKDGAWRWHTSTGSPLRDEAGRVAGYLGIARDVTERRQAEETLRSLAESGVDSREDILRFLVRKLAVSQEVRYALLACVDPNAPNTAQTIAVWSGSDFIPNFSYALDGTPCQNVTAQGACFYPDNIQKLFPQDHLLEEMNAESYWGTPLRDRAGNVLGILAILDDRPMEERAHTLALLNSFAARAAAELERQRTEQKLRESEARYRSLTENFPNGALFLFDQEFRYLAANGKGFARAGLSSPEVVGKTVGEVFPELWDYIRPYHEAALQGQEGYYEVEYRDRLYSNQVVPVTNEDGLTGQGIVISQDITERKKAEAEKTKLATQLNQAQKLESVGRLAGGVAHDLNNLLTPILGYGELLLGDFGEDDTRRADLEKILQAGRRARDLVRQLLAFSRRQVLELEPVNLNQVLDDFKNLLRRTIREDVAIEVNLNPSLPLVKGDIGQLEQVIMNLAINAQDAMPNGGLLSIQTGVVHRDHVDVSGPESIKPGAYVMLSVSDTGCGMDARTRERIFEPFFTTKTKDKGTGLGLATVYGIVKQHGGSIWVYSEPGQGSTFKVYLPVAGESSRPQANVTLEPEDWSGSETILLVEDDKPVRDLAEAILKRQGYTLLVAQNGPEALARLEEKYSGPIHLLLTDVVMPGMSGRELFTRLSAHIPDLKVLYMSGYTNNVIAHHGVLDEGVNYIQKPFSLQGLAAKVREVLDMNS